MHYGPPLHLPQWRMLLLVDYCSQLLAFCVLWPFYLSVAIRSLVRGISSPERSSTIQLPPEILDLIFGFHIESILAQRRPVRDYRKQRQQWQSEIIPLAQCCREFYALVKARWSRTWVACGPDACLSHMALQPGPLIRVITADEGCMPPGVDLADYLRLEIASLYFHSALEYNKPRNEFRLLKSVVAFPASLTQLEILHSHTPEQEIIELVSSCCPALFELRIVRCTMFNKPECWWWRAHTDNTDHDYMRGHSPQNAEDLANSMALMLRELPKLQALHVGYYLTDTDAVFNHRVLPEHKRHHPPGFYDRLSHVDGIMVHNPLQFQATLAQDGGPPININATRLADKKLWGTPCGECERELGAAIERAERWVASKLATQLESIRTISFPNFLSKNRICPSRWQVRREIKSTPDQTWVPVDTVEPPEAYPLGERMRVKTWNTDRPRSVEYFGFEMSNAGWQLVPL